MKRPPIIPHVLVALMAFCIGFLLLYAALISITNTSSMYSHITDPQQQLENRAIISYLSSPLFSQNTLTFLTPDEQSHMTDVKRLFDIAEIIYFCCIGIMIGIIVIFAYNKMWKKLDELFSKSLRICGWTILAIALVLGLASLLDFTKFWIVFHSILFPQGNWMFAADSILITLYPAEFFSSFVLRWTLYATTFAACAIVISFFMDRMRLAEQQFNEKYKRKK